MPNLNDVLAAILSSIASARRMADEQTVRMAEAYLADPLLSAMTVPRIRLPEVVVDLPILIEGCDFGRPAQEASARAAPTPLKPSVAGFADLARDVLARVHGGGAAPARGPSAPMLRVLVAAADLAQNPRDALLTHLKLTLREEGLEVSSEEANRDLGGDDGPRARDAEPEAAAGAPAPRRVRLMPE